MVMLAGVEFRSDDQMRLLEAAIGTLRRLATAAPEVVENRVNLAASIANLRRIRKHQGQTAAAVAAFTEAADLIEVAVAAVPTRKERGYRTRFHILALVSQPPPSTRAPPRHYLVRITWRPPSTSTTAGSKQPAGP